MKVGRFPACFVSKQRKTSGNVTLIIKDEGTLGKKNFAFLEGRLLLLVLCLFCLKTRYEQILLI